MKVRLVLAFALGCTQVTFSDGPSTGGAGGEGASTSPSSSTGAGGEGGASSTSTGGGAVGAGGSGAGPVCAEGLLTSLPTCGGLVDNFSGQLDGDLWTVADAVVTTQGGVVRLTIPPLDGAAILSTLGDVHEADGACQFSVRVVDVPLEVVTSFSLFTSTSGNVSMQINTFGTPSLNASAPTVPDLYTEPYDASATAYLAFRFDPLEIVYLASSDGVCWRVLTATPRYADAFGMQLSAFYEANPFEVVVRYDDVGIPGQP